jgi:hypothetical protein
MTHSTCTSTRTASIASTGRPLPFARLLRLASVAVLCAAAAATAHGRPLPTPAVPANAFTITVSGNVTDNAGAPLAGADVRVSASFRQDPNSDFGDLNRPSVYTRSYPATADSYGRYSVSVLAVPRAGISTRASAPYHATQFSRSISVSSAQDLTFDFALRPTRRR